MTCAGFFGVSVIGAACTTEYQRGAEDPNFGDPNALANQSAPGKTSDNKQADGGGGGGGTPVCVQAGKNLAYKPGDPCTVSLKNDIIPVIFKVCSTPSCHGGTTPPSKPRIDPAAANEMWDLWQKHTVKPGPTDPPKPYIDPCSKNPADSTIACNVNAANKCGTLMPVGATGLPTADITKIEDWLKCGAPNN
jgi:hypothetical protein